MPKRTSHACAVVLFALVLRNVFGTLSDVTIAPNDDSAGITGTISITFVSDLSIALDSELSILLPTGFEIASTAAASPDNSNSDGTTLSVVSQASTSLRCKIETAAISSFTAFAFDVTDVTNPAEGSWQPTTLILYDSEGIELDRTSFIPAIDIVLTPFSSVATALDTTDAGATGAASISFTTDVALKIGSKIVVVFPAALALQPTEVTPTSSILDSSSTLSYQAPSTATVVIQGTDISAGEDVSFSLDGITNPGESSLADFVVTSTDGSNKIYQRSPVAGGDITSTELTDVHLVSTSLLAGTPTAFTIEYTSKVPIPVNGMFVLSLPTDYKLDASSFVLSDSNSGDSISGILSSQLIVFPFDAAVASGAQSFTLEQVFNPSARTTDTFMMWTADANGLLLEVAVGINGFEIAAGTISDAHFQPQRANPGLDSSATLTFTTSARLVPGSYLQLFIPQDDYKPVGSGLFVDVQTPSSITATITWDTGASKAVIKITGPNTIPPGADVTISLSTFQMPPSVRAATSTASIESYDASDLALDASSVVNMAEIEAVTILNCVWTTFSPNPGILSSVEIVFETSGRIPASGAVKILLPSDDFSAAVVENAPSITFIYPSNMTGTGSFDADLHELEIVLDEELPRLGTVKLQVATLNTPWSVRSANRSGSTLRTLDTVGVTIDGPSLLQLDAIQPGPLLGDRLWTSSEPYAGITSDQEVTWMNHGQLSVGSRIEITLPVTGWSASEISTVDLISPNIGLTFSYAFDLPTRTLTLTIDGSVDLPSNSVILLQFPGVKNPPNEVGNTKASVTTFAPDGIAVDGPDTISIRPIGVGQITGVKTLTSVNNAASMASDQEVRVTLNGALASGGFIYFIFPQDVGWRALTLPLDVQFSSPPDITATSVEWTAAECEVRIEIDGNIPERTDIEVVVKGLANPYQIHGTSLLTVLTKVSTRLAVDASDNIVINSISSGELPSGATWTSTIATPGVSSTHILSLTTAGEMLEEASICLSFPKTDSWVFQSMNNAKLTDESTGKTDTTQALWYASRKELCVMIVSTIKQETSIIVEIIDVVSPMSVRSETNRSMKAVGHLEGDIASGTYTLNAVTAGELTGSLSWESAFYSPGAVAGLRTSATLMFTTIGAIPTGSAVVLTLPVEWKLLPECFVSRMLPPLSVSALCSDNILTILLENDVNEGQAIELELNGVINPPTTQPAGIATATSYASDGGIIDQSIAITTNAIVSQVTDIQSAGDVRVAVRGVEKVFTFVGDSVASQDIVKFMPFDTSSDTNCGTFTSGMSDAGGVTIQYLDSKLSIALTFGVSSIDGQPFTICYKHGSNPFRLYSSFAFYVKEVKEIVVNEGLASLAVSNYIKNWRIVGNGLADGDSIRWIDLDIVNAAISIEDVDCSDTNHLAVLLGDDNPLPGEDDYTRVLNRPLFESMYAFTEADAGKTFCLCMKFGQEPFTVYPTLQVRVNHVSDMTAAVMGSNDVVVADATKRFLLHGHGLKQSHRIFFIESDGAEDCHLAFNDETRRLRHYFDNQYQTILYLDADQAFDVHFDSADAGKWASLCYEFENEPFQYYPSHSVYIHGVSGFSGSLGEPDFAVAHVPEPLTYFGFGLHEGDQVRWVANGQSDCETNFGKLVASDTSVVFETTTLDSDSSASFNFSSDQVDYNPVLCYKFGSEEYKLYEQLTISIGTIKRKVATVGEKDVAVTHYRKLFALQGENTAKGDRVAWTFDTSVNSCDDLAQQNIDAETGDGPLLAYVNDDLYVGVNFISAVSGLRVSLCYGFGTEPLKLYSNLQVRVKSVKGVLAGRGSPSIAVVGAPKSLEFRGDGVSTGDFAKFVAQSPDGCNQPGVSLIDIAKEYDRYDDMALYLYQTMAGVTSASFNFVDDDMTPGEQRVLCYSFSGKEPYFYYEDFVIDIHTARAFEYAEGYAFGDPSIAVAREIKKVVLTGVGITQHDVVKFISSTAASDQDCLDFPPMGMSSDVTVEEDGVITLAFDHGSKDTAWRLCYRTGDEPYRLFPSMTMEVKEITNFLDYLNPKSTVLSRMATIGHEKVWQPIGSGISAGDTVKFVYRTVVSSDACGGTSANMVLGTTMMTVSAEHLTFTGLFTQYPSVLSDAYHICYQFQNEPFAYIPNFDIKTFGIKGIDRSTILAQAATLIRVQGFRISSDDQLAWTKTESCADAFKVSNVVDTEAVVQFDTVYDELFLCYSFSRQRWERFDSIRLSVVQADIWVPSVATIVAQQEEVIEVSGTFGLTMGESSLAWIPADASACSESLMDAYAGIMQSSIVASVASSTSVARSGSSVFRVKYEAPGAETTEGITGANIGVWKLCFKFGSMSSTLLFDDVLCEVLNVYDVSLVARDTTLGGTTMTFQFKGVGLEDMDMAKWVAASDVVSDEDCETAPPLGESVESAVLNSRATFTFHDVNTDMALCYLFKGHSYKLYAGLNVRDATSASSVSSVQRDLSATTEEENHLDAVESEQIHRSSQAATVRLRLDRDIDLIPPGSDAEATFKTDFISALSIALDIPASRVVIKQITRGSVIVEFDILPSDNVADPLANEVVQSIASELEDPQGTLKDNAVMADIDTQDGLQTIYYFLDIEESTPKPFKSVPYQRKGLFTFVQPVYSITEESSTLSIPIMRLHGTNGMVTVPIDIDYSGIGSATFDEDYSIVTDLNDAGRRRFVRFDAGEKVKYVDVVVANDSMVEAHFESFEITLQTPEALQTALGDIYTTTIRIYDSRQGEVLASSTFGNSDPQGWSVVGNGNDAHLRVSSNGIFAVDNSVGEGEYNEKCDAASPTGSCSYTCTLGGNILHGSGLSSPYNSLLLDGDDYAVSTSELSSFPTKEFTLSLWVKTTSTSTDNCLFSYSIVSSTTPLVALAICNPSNLQIYINAHNDLDGLTTFVNISDGAWHFIALEWDSQDGRVYLFDNALLVFDGGPYHGGMPLHSARGLLILGALVLSGSEPYCTNTMNESLEGDRIEVSCDIVLGSGFRGELQHLHVWSRALSLSELRREVAWPMQVTLNGLVVGWNFDRPHLLDDGYHVNDITTTGQQAKHIGYIYCSTLLGSSSCFSQGSVPSLYSPSFPCGPVYANLWHFSAPEYFVQQLAFSYGGRLQYKMLAPSYNGRPRPRRGQISLFASDGTHLSRSLGSFQLPLASSWTYYSVILREDFAWIQEPAGTSVSTETFRHVLETASSLWIRGDLWGSSTSGLGQEVVYLNDVILHARP